MANYIGETVTVFVESEEFPGRFYRHTFICKWSVHWASYFHSSAPACSWTIPVFYILSVHTVWDSLILISASGSLAIIPVDKITSFVHNLVWIEITYLFADFAFQMSNSKPASIRPHYGQRLLCCLQVCQPPNRRYIQDNHSNHRGYCTVFIGGKYRPYPFPYPAA